MPRLIPSPTSIPVPGGKRIDEYVGGVNTQTDWFTILTRLAEEHRSEASR